MFQRTEKMIVISILCSLIIHSIARYDGYLQFHGIDHKYEYYLLPFSNLDYPSSLVFNFTVIQDGDFCDPSNIIGPNLSTAAIINHGPCSVSIEAQNLLSVGYKYAIIADFDSDSIHNEEYPQNQMIIALPGSLSIFGKKYSQVASIEVSITPYNITEFICICDSRSQFFVDRSFISSLSSSVSLCISQAIYHMNRAGKTHHSLQEMSAAVSLLKLLLQFNLLEDARVLSKWISWTLISNKRNYLTFYSSNIHAFAVLIFDLISTLYTIGEWHLGSQLLALQSRELCGRNSLQVNYHDICSKICSFVFVTTFGTLRSPILSDVNSSEYSDDWTVTTTEIEPNSKQNVNIDALTICLDIMDVFVAHNGSADQLNIIFLEKVADLGNHPVFWLSANELSYLCKKYGILNTIVYLRQTLELNDFSLPTPTSHLLQYKKLLGFQEECNETTLSFMNATCSLLRITPNIRYDYMPLSSQNVLKKNIKLGRSRKKSDILNEALLVHLTRDMIDIQTKLSVFWDEYGSFITSQRHTLLRISMIFCQKLSIISGCPSDSDLLSISCLFERPIVATPMIFASFDEFRSFRTQQLSTMASISSIISKSASHINEVLKSNKHLELISLEAQITSTPPSMMIGYQFEIQDMGDRALAPAMSVLPSSFDILSQRHQSDAMCHLPPSLLNQPPTQRPSAVSKIQVGFLSRYFYEHSVGRLIEGVITSLNKTKFEVIVFCLCCSSESESNDSLQQRLRSSQVIWVDLQNQHQSQSTFHCSYQFLLSPNEYQNAISIILTQQLDILLYPELGMDSLTVLFAHQRLAPVQVVFWGHPISQNLPTIDYFISSSLFDIHNPRCQYPRLGHEKCPIGFTAYEQIVHLNGLTTIFYPLKFTSDTSRNPFEKYKYHLLPERRSDMHVYLLPHTIMKYSTAFIRTIATILLKDESGILVILYNSNQALWYQKLQLSIQQQLKKLYCQIKMPDHELFSSFPEHHHVIPSKYPGICYLPSCGICCDCADSVMLQSTYKRIVLIPKVARNEYLSLLKHASILLDPFPFGMGVTAFETFSMGLPVVTLPSYQSTPALVSGMIQTMQLNMSTKSSLIATSPIDYIEKAIKISAIGNHRNQILDELRKSSYRLFNDSSTINDWEEFFQRVVFL